MLPAWPFGFLPGSPGVLFLFSWVDSCIRRRPQVYVFLFRYIVLERSMSWLICCSLSFLSTSHMGSCSGSFRFVGMWLWYAFIRHRLQHGLMCPQPACALFSSSFSRPVSGDAFVFWSLMPSTVSRLSPVVACLWHAQLPTCPFEARSARSGIAPLLDPGGPARLRSWFLSVPGSWSCSRAGPA